MLELLSTHPKETHRVRLGVAWHNERALVTWRLETEWGRAPASCDARQLPGHYIERLGGRMIHAEGQLKGNFKGIKNTETVFECYGGR